MFAFRRYGQSFPCCLSPSLSRLRAIPEARGYRTKGAKNKPKTAESKDANPTESSDPPVKRPKGRPRKTEAEKELAKALKKANEPPKPPKEPKPRAPRKPRRTGIITAQDLHLVEDFSEGTTAQKLLSTGVWNKRSAKSGRVTKGARNKRGDHTKVNIVSESLCDDVLSYIGSSLQRHRGCDILDIYPGAGLWSKKLHDVVQPRSHIMMEPDDELYLPFLKPLLEKPGTKLIPKSGIVWRELVDHLNEDNFPHQKVPTSEEELTSRNDTLLVTANLAFHPRKAFRGFESVATLLLHQFLSSIRASSLFQRYGQVRMLVWVRQDDKDSVLAKTIQRRKKTAIDGDLYCEWIREVCGDGDDSSHDWYVRDQAIDHSITRRVMQQMHDDRLQVPKARESPLLAATRAASRTTIKGVERIPKPGTVPPSFMRDDMYLGDLQTRNKQGLIEVNSAEAKQLQNAIWRQNAQDKRLTRIHSLLLRLDALVALHKEGETSEEELDRLELELKHDIDAQSRSNVSTCLTIRDNLHTIRQDPPLFHWDQRPYEPLRVEADEFLPMVECTLLDIQPKAPHPMLRQIGQGTNRAGDTMDLVITSMMSQSSRPVGKVLDSVWPGAADYIMPRWKSLRDLDNGGLPGGKTQWMEMSPRVLNTRQWEELAELWMEWPFRPDYIELVSRTGDGEDDRDDEAFNTGGSPGLML